MRRTRKWAFVAQEATRLAALGLSPAEIGARLDVPRQTVYRWMKEGKLVTPESTRATVSMTVRANQTPEQWAADVRNAYALDATDEQLVSMAEAALLIWRDPAASAPLRMQAMREFRATVKQLALVARATEQEQAAPPQSDKPKLRVVRHSAGDPRRGLMAVSE